MTGYDRGVLSLWPRLQVVIRALHLRRLEHLHHIAQPARRRNVAVHHQNPKPKISVDAEVAGGQGRGDGERETRQRV